MNSAMVIVQVLRRAFVGLLAAAALAGPVQARDVFFFGNGLVSHPTSSDETSVPHWLALMAREAGHDFRADGTSGVLPDFVRDLPPEAAWSFTEVEPAWNPEAQAFRMAGFDDIILAPSNVIQRELPDADALGGSAVVLSAGILGWAANQMPEAEGPRLLIYEGWANMDSFGSFPLDADALMRWHNWNREGSHDWYEAYVERLREELPGRDVALIPVGSTLSALLTEAPLDAIAVDALFTDAVPHGTATTYLLAAMVTYAVLYGEAPPAIALSGAVDPLLRDNYAAVANRVAEATGGAPRLEAMSVPTNPSLGLGLSGIADWSTEQPFLDVMKTARPWIGHEPEAWGAWDTDRLAAGGHLSPEGWPLSLPDGVTALESLVLTDQPEAGRSLAGTYLLRWEGRGDVSVAGRATDAVRDGASIRFNYDPGEGLVAIAVTAVDPADPLRAFTLVREDRRALLDGGALFNPDFLARVEVVRALRFMDWMSTNGSEQVEWDDRPHLTDATWAVRGVPVEVMVRLANETGTDPWFTLPHQVSDDYVRAFAEIVRDTLDPRLKVHAEWSNEVWNFIFPQAAWARDQAIARWGDDAPDDAWMQFAGLRAAEVADIWAKVFTLDPDRLVRVVSVHTGWLGLEDALLDAPLVVEEGRQPPSAFFDAYAVTGYIGPAIDADEYAPALRAWIAEGTAEVGITALAQADARALIEEIWPYHAAAAAARDLALVVYEGGPHVVGLGAVTEDEAITAALTAWSYSPALADLQAEVLTAWDDVGGTLYMAFVDVAAPSRWGSWGALRHLDDANPRWDALMDANARPPSWETRDPAAFMGTP